MFYRESKEKAQNLLKEKESEYCILADNAKDITLKLYEARKSAVLAINRIESYVSSLANTKKEFAKEIAEICLSIKEFNKAIKLEEENNTDNLIAGGTTVAGIMIGELTALLGPKAAIAVATTFGKAQTGKAISELSGAAANRAAIAWLGRISGGQGMKSGQQLLNLLKKSTWPIAAIAIIGGGALYAYNNKKSAEEAYEEVKCIEEQIHILKQEINSLSKLHKETLKLKSALNISKMVNTYPNDYMDFNEDQKAELSILINNARSMGKLITKAI